MTPEQCHHFETIFLPALRRCQKRRERAAQEALMLLQRRRGVMPSLVPTTLSQEMIAELDDYIAAGILKRKPSKTHIPKPTAAQTFIVSKRGLVSCRIAEEAANLRRANPIVWSWVELGRKYNINRQTIRRAIIKLAPDLLETASP